MSKIKIVKPGHTHAGSPIPVGVELDTEDLSPVEIEFLVSLRIGEWVEEPKPTAKPGKAKAEIVIEETQGEAK